MLPRGGSNFRRVFFSQRIYTIKRIRTGTRAREIAKGKGLYIEEGNALSKLAATEHNFSLTESSFGRTENGRTIQRMWY